MPIQHEVYRIPFDQLTCAICREPVNLETAKTNEDGDGVHEDCYVQNMIRTDPEFDQRVEFTQRGFFVGQKTAQRQILHGWKEIANYLGKGVRTVQHYERVVSLPIHRPTGKSSGGAVVAIPAELDNWVIVSDRRMDSLPMRRTLDAQTNRLRANFLQIDSEIALTFSDIAMHASDHEKRKRTAQTARRAYDTI